MRPIDICYLLNYYLLHPEQRVNTDISFSISIPEVFEKVQRQTAQRARFMQQTPIADERQFKDRIESSFDLNTVTEDEQALFAQHLLMGCESLLPALSPYCKGATEPLKPEADRIVFAAFMPPNVIPANALAMITTNIRNAVYYYCLTEWYSMGGYNDAGKWNKQYEDELAQLRSNLLKRIRPISTTIRSLG